MSQLDRDSDLRPNKARRSNSGDAQRIRRWLTLIVLAAIPTAVGGCGGSDAGTGATGRAISVKTSPQVRLTLAHASNLATQKCMHRLGFDYYVPPITQEPQADVSFPYGNDDVSFARRYPATVHRTVLGGVEDLAKSRHVPQPTPGLKRAGTPEWRKALFGTGETVTIPLPGGGQQGMFVGGCTANGVRAVFGSDVKRWLVVSTVVDSLDSVVNTRVKALPAYMSAYAEWSECVKRAGYQPSSSESRMLIASASDSRANVTNARCGARAGVEATGKRLESQVRPIVNSENESAIVDYNALVATAKERVARGK